MKDLEKDLMRFCEQVLYKLTNFEELEYLHWVSSGYGDGFVYCFECCDKEVEKVNKELIAKGEIVIDEDGDICAGDGAFVDGGWSGIEEDGCAFCEGCNKRLEVSLTQYGVESEVDHFIEYFFDDKNEVTEITNDQMIELHGIFECCGYNDFDKKYERDLLRLAKIVLSILGESMGVESRFELLDL